MRLVALGACVPAACSDNAGVWESSEEHSKFIESTGIARRHLVGDTGLTALDLCAAATPEVLRGAGWSAHDVDGVLFMTQTPDHRLPGNACLLQQRLGLRDDLFALDVNLGCSAWSYGLVLIEGLMATRRLERCLLVVGDTISGITDPLDHATTPLFGDAGTVVAIEAGTSQIKAASWGTDGSGARHLMAAAAAAEMPGVAPYLSMEGSQVFAFALRRVPALIDQLTAESGWKCDDLDACVLHQANRFMIKQLARKCGLSEDRLPLSLDEYGNTSGASIPLTLVTRLASTIESGRSRIIVAGFGVGWSWSGVALELEDVAVAPLLTLEGSEAECSRTP